MQALFSGFQIERLFVMRFRIQFAMDAHTPHPDDDPTTRTGRILFLIILAVIVGSIAIFVILHPGHS